VGLINKELYMLGSIKTKIIQKQKRESVNSSRKEYRSGHNKSTKLMRRVLRYLKNATINL
jgi:hypothetical protein